MKINDIAKHNHFRLITPSVQKNTSIHNIFACDLLSHVMGFADESDILITVLNNMNVIGVANLLDLSGVIFAQGVKISDEILEKATSLDIPVFQTKLSTANAVWTLKTMKDHT